MYVDRDPKKLVPPNTLSYSTVISQCFLPSLRNVFTVNSPLFANAMKRKSSEFKAGLSEALFHADDVVVTAEVNR